jgi:hypothetical protein
MLILDSLEHNEMAQSPITIRGRLTGTVFVPNNWRYTIVPEYVDDPVASREIREIKVPNLKHPPLRGYNPHDKRTV